MDSDKMSLKSRFSIDGESPERPERDLMGKGVVFSAGLLLPANIPLPISRRP